MKQSSIKQNSSIKQSRVKPVVATLAVMTAMFTGMGSQAQSMRPSLDFKTAEAIHGHCLAYARQTGHAVAIAIFDHGGNLVSFANDGASTAAGEVAQWKGRSAAIYRNSTLNTASWNVPTAPMISTAEGGVPVFTKDGIAIGGIGVSGAPSEFDAECGTRAAEAAGLRASRTEG